MTRLVTGAVLVATCATCLVAAGCRRAADAPATPPHKRVIVLGFDGMDPRLAERMMDAGELPNLAALRAGGGYSRLGTSIPPQSPVAWATFITGANPGVHGIFDFIHRRPESPGDAYYSAAETVPSDEGWEVGDHKLPLAFWPFNHQPTQTLLRREGTPFWEHLDAAGVPVRLYDLPANYPPTPSRFGNACCLCGMGVPDLLGTYGTYQYFGTDVPRPTDETGGMRRPLVFQDGAAAGRLDGPMNTLLKRAARAYIPFTVYRHESEPAARIDIGGETIVLREGEWSEWVRVRYRIAMPDFLPDEKLSGICRFYLRRTQPEFQLYVTPINIDPSDPGAQRISEPAGFVRNLYRELGLFPTAGFQEDYNARINGVLSDEEYQAQADSVLAERERLLDLALRDYAGGLLFFYFSSTDLQAHMFWWDSDAPHPVRPPQEARRFHSAIRDIYRAADGVVGRVLERFGRDAIVLVLSDHGFCNFERQVNLNTFLRQEGYLMPATARSLRGARSVEWSQTRAYAIGLNGVYLNLRGRERDGVVDPAERDALLEELRARLLALRDPRDGKPAVKHVYRADEIYRGPQANRAPDLVVGFHRGFRASWATVLGEITDELFLDNDRAWSADHCIAADEVPGVLFSNRPLVRAEPSLPDIAPTVLREFGVAIPASMEGGSVFEPRPPERASAARD